MTAHSFPRVGTWIDRFAARQILAAANRQNFHQYPRPTMWGEDRLDWVASDDRGDAVVAELHCLREREMFKRTGYQEFADANRVGRDQGLAYMAVDGAVPTISDALEAEFARREGRGIKVQVRPTEAEVEALKAFIALPVMEGRAH